MKKLFLTAVVALGIVGLSNVVNAQTATVQPKTTISDKKDVGTADLNDKKDVGTADLNDKKDVGTADLNDKKDVGTADLNDVHSLAGADRTRIAGFIGYIQCYFTCNFFRHVIIYNCPVRRLPFANG